MIAPDHIRAIAPYQPGKPIAELAREMGLAEADIVKLASNENPLGVSPKARAAIAGSLDALALYPDGNGYELKSAIARKYGVGLDQIVLGNGSNDVLELAARALLTPGTSAVYAQHAFAVYPLVTQACGATGIEAKAKHFGHDLGAMRAAIRPDTRIVFIANPNNPTGTFVAHERIAAFLARVPRDVLIVLDEAYNEYLPPELRFDSTAWVREYPNLLVARTFSKAFGLAGLRVGYGIAQAELTDLLNRVRQPFNVNTLAQAAAAAALADVPFVTRSYELNRRGLAELYAAFERLRLAYVPSYGNFVMVKVGRAGRVYEELLKRGVIVRPIANYGLPEWLRVTVGLPQENAAFLRALEEALAAAS